MLERLNQWLSRPWRAWAVALALSLGQAGLLLHCAWDKADTEDEVLYWTSAARWWNGGRHFLTWPAAIQQLGIALTTRLSGPEISQLPPLEEIPTQAEASEIARRLLWQKPYQPMRWALLWGRLATVLAVVAGGLCLGRAASRLGAVPGLAVQLLWCTSPTVLAFGHQMLLDAWTAAALCAGLLGAARMVERPTVARAAVAGALAALAIPTKISTLPGVGMIMAAVVWAAFARGTFHPGRWRRAAAALGASGGALAFTLVALHRFRPEGTLGVLLAVFVGGVERGLASGTEASYALGDLHRGGVRWFYLLAMGVKLTAGALLFGLFAAGGWLRRRPGGREALYDLAILTPALVVLGVMSASSHQPTIGFLLPAFPFAMLWAGRALSHLGRAFGPRAVLAALALIAAGTVESLWAHPDQQMFFNVLAGGPERGPRLLVKREDTGQDRRRLGEWQQARGHPTIRYLDIVTGASSSAAWGIRHDPALPCRPEPGVYVVHARELFAPKLIEPGCLDWLSAVPPGERIGQTLYVWEVDEAEAKARARPPELPFWSSAHQKGVQPRIVAFSARPEGEKVRLTWRTERVSFSLLASLDQPDSPGILDMALASAGTATVDRNQTGYYGILGMPDFIIAAAHVDGPALLARARLPAGEETLLLWNVPQGPVTIQDDTGAVVAQSEELLGQVFQAPSRTTTYQLTYGAGGKLTRTVEVLSSP